VVSVNAQQYDIREEDNFSLCNFFFDHVLNEAGRQPLTDNIARHLSNTKQKSIRVHTIANFASVEPRYGQCVGRKGGKDYYRSSNKNNTNNESLVAPSAICTKVSETCT
jgi:catalase